MQKLNYEQYRKRLLAILDPNLFHSKSEISFPFDTGTVSFRDKEDERRILIDVREPRSKRLVLRIRTDGKAEGSHRVSGCVVEDSVGNMLLLHDATRVNDVERPPQVHELVTFDGRPWSSFAINSNLATELVDYALTRPSRA